MPFVKLYVHVVFATKNRFPYLETFELRQTVWKHIKANAAEKGIVVDSVSGYKEHCHCLISLNAYQSISDVVKLIKGESSFWINKEKLTLEHFEWQREYYAAAVSESILKATRNYIFQQEKHHSTINFENEFLDFREKFKL